jgi:hypothetical protein
MNYKMNRLLRVMLIICITILLSVHNLCAQEVWEELAEQLMDEDENSSFQWDTHFEELSELRENPININTATKEQLERFPFLSDQLVENILYYLYKYGPMLTRNELWMIEDIDRQTIHYLLPFIYFETPEKEQYKPNIKRILKYGKQELSTRVDIPFYTKAGYQQYPAETLKRIRTNSIWDMDIIIICDIVFIIGIRFMQELLLKRMQENLSLPDKIKRL